MLSLKKISIIHNYLANYLIIISITVMLLIESIIGIALGTTQGSCLPFAYNIVSIPS